MTLRWHWPEAWNGVGLVLTHGAGSNCEAPLLVAVAEAVVATGAAVLRCNLGFRDRHPSGPPRGSGAEDRASLARAVGEMRAHSPKRVVLGGHSYGGRQATMLAAEDAGVADGLLLLSFPLHPPRRPAGAGEAVGQAPPAGVQIRADARTAAGDRTSHFPRITTPCVFVHGTRDPFGSIAEMESALELIAAPHRLIVIASAGHDLRVKGAYGAAARAAAERSP
jgi:predicted alpha/beta-hydrolase family hydrolase